MTTTSMAPKFNQPRIMVKRKDDHFSVLIPLVDDLEILRRSIETTLNLNTNSTTHSNEQKANKSEVKCNLNCQPLSCSSKSTSCHHNNWNLVTSNGALVTDASLLKEDEEVIVVENLNDLSNNQCQDKYYIKGTSEGLKNNNSAPSSCIYDSVNNANSGDWIKLNVGGSIFSTTRGTLTQQEPDSMLARMFTTANGITPSPVDSNGAYMIDRSGKYFEPILSYLRNGGQLILDQGINPLGVLEEARFYGIQSLVNNLENLIGNESEFEYSFNKCAFIKKAQPLTRSHVVNALITCDRSTELRFQGVDLTGANLSRLDLHKINFKYAILKNCNLTGCNFSSACLERADLSGCTLDNAILSGVRMICANLEGSSLKGINAETDSNETGTSMEGVNLKVSNYLI